MVERGWWCVAVQSDIGYGIIYASPIIIRRRRNVCFSQLGTLFTCWHLLAVGFSELFRICSTPYLHSRDHNSQINDVTNTMWNTKFQRVGVCTVQFDFCRIEPLGSTHILFCVARVWCCSSVYYAGGGIRTCQFILFVVTNRNKCIVIGHHDIETPASKPFCGTESLRK